MKTCKRGHKRKNHLVRCPKCKQATRSRHYKADKELNKKKVYAWRKKNPDRAKSIGLKCQYGITLEERNEISKSQGHKCAICFRHESKLKKILFVDHCHKTDKVRGLLCEDCNWALGVFKDDADRFKSAAAYLNKHKEK
jgi:hypothetical protein